MSLAIVVCASCLALSPSILGAAPLSEDVPVPGGTAALSQALGLDSAPEPARFMTELIRVIYDAPDGTSSATDALLRNLTNYLKSTGTASRARVPRQRSFRWKPFRCPFPPRSGAMRCFSGR